MSWRRWAGNQSGCVGIRCILFGVSWYGRVGQHLTDTPRLTVDRQAVQLMRPVGESDVTTPQDGEVVGATHAIRGVGPS